MTTKTQPESTGLASLTNALPPRLWLFLGILALECLAIVQFPRPHLAGRQLLAAPIVFGGALLFFGRRKLLAAPLDRRPLQPARIALHAAILLLLPTSAWALSHLTTPHSPAAIAAACLWYASILLLALSLAAVLFPLRQLARALASLNTAWLYAALVAVAAMSARIWVDWLWDTPNSRFGHALQVATFVGVKAILSLFYTGILSYPQFAVLGTPRFRVQIAGTCSGIEGLALMLILTVGWLIFARRELRLLRAIWLVPVSLAAIWLLNLVRIAALIALGDAGHPAIALDGFHSEAGWILFNAVALAFLLSAQHLRWLRRSSPDPAIPEPTTTATHNPTALYLLPFLAVLATSLLTRAASSGFEWLYPLRLLAALAVLWTFRSEYRRLDWRFGWLGPAAGVATAAIWLAFATRPHTASTLPALAPTWQRFGWLAARTAAAVLTVPIAEELAFRGYLARRLVSAGFDTLPYNRLTPLAIAVSAAAFGLLHGRLWIPGILAGLLFALVARLRNRLGEAVAAHATANLLIAAWVLATGDLTLW